MTESTEAPRTIDYFRALVGHHVTITNPIHPESRWSGTAIAYSDGPNILLEAGDGSRLMLPAIWAEIDHTPQHTRAWADRLLSAQKLTSEAYLHGDAPPTSNQVAAVLHALADHTLLTQVLASTPIVGADRAHLGELFRDATGLGRLLQSIGDAIEHPLDGR